MIALFFVQLLEKFRLWEQMTTPFEYILEGRQKGYHKERCMREQ